jgi:lysophospholipase L1-like esterase
VLFANRFSRAGRAAFLRLARSAAGVLALGVSLSCSSPTTPTPPPPTDPPSIVCPAPEAVTAPQNLPIPVIYGTPVTTGGKAPVTTACAPVSGAEFPVGVTTVTCTATDAEQRTSSCAVAMTVLPPPEIAVTRFIAFGDSITAGEDGAAITTMWSGPWHGDTLLLPMVILVGQEYPTVLQNELRNRYTLQTSSITVRNAGLRAERAGDSSTLTRFQREVVNGGYQAVLLMEGSNDLIEAYNGSSRAVQDALNNLRSMVRTARGAGIRPYLATIPPASRESPCGPPCRGVAADLVPGFNDQVRGIAAAEGVPMVDVFAAFGGDRTLISADGLHPNAAGYERVAMTFLDSIKATLETVRQSGAPAISRSSVRSSRYRSVR